MTITFPDPLMSAAVILGISGAALVAAKSSQVRRAVFSCWIFGFYWITAVFGFINIESEYKQNN